MSTLIIMALLILVVCQRARIKAQDYLIKQQRIGLRLDEELLAAHGIWKRES